MNSRCTEGTNFVADDTRIPISIAERRHLPRRRLKLQAGDLEAAATSIFNARVKDEFERLDKAPQLSRLRMQLMVAALTAKYGRGADDQGEKP
jgi:hypothetical protein